MEDYDRVLGENDVIELQFEEISVRNGIENPNGIESPRRYVNTIKVKFP